MLWPLQQRSSMTSALIFALDPGWYENQGCGTRLASGLLEDGFQRCFYLWLRDGLIGLVRGI